jgi:ribosomal protein L15
MSNVIAVLNEERTRVARRLAALDAAIKALGGGTAASVSVVKHKRRKLSAEARARISAAQKARWAKTKTKK